MFSFQFPTLGNNCVWNSHHKLTVNIETNLERCVKINFKNRFQLDFFLSSKNKILKLQERKLIKVKLKLFSKKKKYEEQIESNSFQGLVLWLLLNKILNYSILQRLCFHGDF